MGFWRRGMCPAAARSAKQAQSTKPAEIFTSPCSHPSWHKKCSIPNCLKKRSK